MNNLSDTLDFCIQKMRESSDFNDYESVSAIKHLMSDIIFNPVQLVNYPNEEKLSLVFSSVITSQFPQNCPIYEGFNVRNVIFVCAYYLYMHQLETGYFYDRNWPAFIILLHLCHTEFAKFSLEMNPFAPERIQKILGNKINYSRLISVAKGVELNMMLVAKKTGFLTEEIKPWFEDLNEEYDNLLSNSDPFREAAIPLYKCIGNYLKENDLTFVHGVK